MVSFGPRRLFSGLGGVCGSTERALPLAGGPMIPALMGWPPVRRRPRGAALLFGLVSAVRLCSGVYLSRWLTPGVRAESCGSVVFQWLRTWTGGDNGPAGRVGPSAWGGRGAALGPTIISDLWRWNRRRPWWALRPRRVPRRSATGLRRRGRDLAAGAPTPNRPIDVRPPAMVFGFRAPPAGRRRGARPGKPVRVPPRASVFPRPGPPGHPPTLDRTGFVHGGCSAGVQTMGGGRSSGAAVLPTGLEGRRSLAGPRPD